MFFNAICHVSMAVYSYNPPCTIPSNLLDNTYSMGYSAALALYGPLNSCIQLQSASLQSSFVLQLLLYLLYHISFEDITNIVYTLRLKNGYCDAP